MKSWETAVRPHKRVEETEGGGGELPRNFKSMIVSNKQEEERGGGVNAPAQEHQGEFKMDGAVCRL